MYDKGMVAIVQGVGYPNPDFSHFRSTEIWQTAAPDAYLTTGWLGRYLDERRACRQDNLFNAIAIARRAAGSARLPSASTCRRSRSSTATG